MCVCFFDQDTFSRAQTWVKELQRQASPSIVIALAGNKADLANKRVVEYDEAQTYADENGLLFMETSAKTAMNVNDIFLAIGESHFPDSTDEEIFISARTAVRKSLYARHLIASRSVILICSSHSTVCFPFTRMRFSGRFSHNFR